MLKWKRVQFFWLTVYFVTNASVTSQTGEEGLAIRICWRRLSIFGHVRRLPEATPAHSALRLAVDARAGGKPDISPEWKRQRGRHCRTWVQQIEDDTGLNVNDAWRIAHDRKSWRALRPVAGQAFHWLTDWLTGWNGSIDHGDTWTCLHQICSEEWYAVCSLKFTATQRICLVEICRCLEMSP